jgi:uncharacterized protein (TIGR02453 family)
MKKALSFLRKIKKNNNTPWMHAHKEEFIEAKAEFDFLTQEVIARITAWDDKMPLMEPKGCTFRFNRDIRFSNDKRPYKENFAAYIGYDGKKGILPGYYLHISSTEIFAAGGVWHPEPPELLAIRKAIASNGEELISILEDKKFKKTFGAMDSQDNLKKVPKGFDPDHEFSELLKQKSFVIRKSFDIKDVTEKNFGKKVDDAFKLMKEFNDFFRKSLNSKNSYFLEDSFIKRL